MPIQIKVEDATYQERLVTLNSNSLFFTLTYNTRNSRWYFEIVDRNNIDVISGVKVLPAQNLTSKYISVNSLIGGNIYCVDTKFSGQDITRDNFGTDRQFQLWYYTTDEEDAILG
tara:strand:+ start:427 stop:771 length:345 start_codon:yes stop_codon:yes gene_type:complete